jgi:hypothetical protein
MATKKASTKDESAKKTTTRRSKRTTVTKAVEEPVVMETQVEITNTVPEEETTQDSSVQQNNGFIAKPKYFTGSIDELNAAIQMAAQQQEQQVGFNNGLQNPALNIQQPQAVVQIPVMEAQVVNPALYMGSEQKAALEQQQNQNVIKKEVQTMTKQETLDKLNETKVEQQQVAEDAKVKALLAEKIADAVAADIKEDKSNKMRDAFVEGVVTGAAVGMGVVAGSYIVDKAITTAEEWYKNRDKAEEVSKLVSGLL